ncbi:SETMR methyltransferase, partial [Acromyrmex insinuator]
IKAELSVVYGESAPSFAIVKRWITEFETAWLMNDERSGRPTTAITDNIEKIHEILKDCRIKVREIAETVDISKERVCHILTEESGMRKLTACLVPRLLTVDQKRIRMNISNFQGPVGAVRRNKSDFLYRLITVNGTWIHYFILETKEQSKQWTAKDFVFIDYFKKDKTITGIYFALLMDKLKAKIVKKVMFHQDDAPFHTSSFALAKIY